jgi:glycerol-3-phosphate dehydrogenase
MFSSELSLEQRDAAILALGKEEFDVLVIGGGVTGAGAALDAASRGLKVALVEARDLASGTSSRSSKLIHGGLRYLEQYDFKLVREALHERELMVSTLSPHLVKPVGFLYPLHEKAKDRAYVGAGLALYDVLRGFQRALPWHKHMSQKKIAEIAPSLRQDIVTGAVKYYDAQVDDARHTMSIIRTARRHGATIATRISVDELIKDGKRVVGAIVIDTVTGKKIKVSAKSVVMCAGIWSDEMHAKFEITPGYGVTMSKGVHIVVPGDAIKSNTGIILKTAISVLFLIPWGDKWIVGTTDTPYDGDRAHPYATIEDVQYILDQANKVLEPQLKREEIIGVYAGLRPLVANRKGSATTKLSREHTTDRSAPGFVSIAGGKYTTYRIMGRDAIDLAVTDLGQTVNQSCTEKLPLVGADGYFALVQQAAQIAGEFGLDQKTVVHLLDRYGSLISEVLQLITEDKKLAQPLAPGLPYLRAEIVYSVSHEGAMSVDDVISRRTRLAFEAPNAAIDLADDIANLIAPYLGWGAKEKKASIAEYKAQVAAEIEALDTLVKP